MNLLTRVCRVPHLGCLQEDLLGYSPDVHSDDGQCHAREDVGVVALSRIERLPLIRHRSERAAAGEYDTAL